MSWLTIVRSANTGSCIALTVRRVFLDSYLIMASLAFIVIVRAVKEALAQ